MEVKINGIKEEGGICQDGSGQFINTMEAGADGEGFQGHVVTG